LLGCGSGIFVSCPDGASKADTSDGGFACRKADGTAHGPFRSLHANGKVAEVGNFVDGLEDGTFEGWFDDGKQFSLGEYRMGHPWNTLSVWHDNGVKSLERGYEEGVPVGIHRWSDDEGNPAQEIEYKDGEKVRSSRWGRAGKKVHEALWEALLKVRDESWNIDGVKVYEAVALQGEAGTLKKWSDEGTMLSLANYSNGYPVDESTFHGNGSVAQKRAYGAEGRLLGLDLQDESGSVLSRLAYDPALPATAWLPKPRRGSTDISLGALGIEVKVGDDVRVAALSHGGPAAVAGVQPGDRILSISDWQLPPAPDEEFVYKRLVGAVGGVVSLVLQPTVGDVRTLEMTRVNRDLVDPRRTSLERWSVAGTRVEQKKYKAGFLIEERAWFDSGNKREAADFDTEGRLVWHRVWHESGQLSEEIAPVQGDTHLLWQQWDEGGTRTGRGGYLWGTTDQEGSLLKDGVFSYWQGADTLKSTVTWKAGLKQGAYSSFHPSGEPLEEGLFKDDLKDGTWVAMRAAVRSDPGIPSSTLESTQIWAAGKRHGAFVRHDEQCGWWVEKGSFKEGVKHGEWSSRPGPRYYSCDESGMAVRGTWSSRNRAETCSKGNYREGQKYGVWKTRKDCWCEPSGDGNCEVLVRKYGNDEVLLSEETADAF